jgi:hypothetical protein
MPISMVSPLISPSICGLDVLATFSDVNSWVNANRLFERQKSNVDSVLQLEALGVTLLEERLGRSRRLADSSGLPREVGSGRIDLIPASAFVSQPGLGDLRT